MRGILMALVGALAWPAVASAGEPWHSVYRGDHRNWTVSAAGGFAFLGLDGDTTLDDSQGDTSVSLDGSLDLGETATFWAEVDVQLFRGKHLRLGYTPLRFDGSDTLDTNLVIDGQAYTVGDRVDTELQLDQYEIAVLWDFYLTEFVTVSPVIQLTVIDAAIDLENETTLISASEDQLLPIPYVGVKGEVYPISRVTLFAEGKGMTLGSLATTFEVQGGLAIHLTKNVSIEGRYRYLDYQFDSSDTEFDLDLSGATVGTRVRF